MRALLKELRRNPDTIAVAVLCLMLGIAGQAAPSAVWAGNPDGMKVRCSIWTNPARTVLDTITERLADLSHRASNGCDRLPRLDF